MNKTANTNVPASTWDAWKDACSVEFIANSEKRRELYRFGHQQLRSALTRISNDVAQMYCGEDIPLERAWLLIEECLYAGTSTKSDRTGKASKDNIVKQAVNAANLEARLALYIKHSIARRILSDEGFTLSQKKSSEGKKTSTWWRMEPLDDDKLEAENQLEPENVIEFEEAIFYYADDVWQEWSRTYRMMATFMLIGFDMKTIEKSDLLKVKKSQLYNMRSRIHKTLAEFDWKDSVTEIRQRVYLTRQLISALRVTALRWLEEVENQKIKRFVEMEAIDSEERS